MTELVFHIHQFVPAAEGKELEHRIALLSARDHASHLIAQVLNEKAYQHAHDAHDLAGAFVFAEVSEARLKIALQSCRHLVMAAYLADHLESEGGIA